ncbi:HNH endonuclease signature motif containing protein [Cryobacterium sp. BB736]|uniref:HNH endonuclease n=1 Tax=Cryobacterium sp. BB736 TaxID=2746963 RepID=UPI00187738DE
MLWDKRQLLGISVIQRIDTKHVSKTVYVCPACEHSSFKPRKSLRPRYRCHKCKHEFDSPKSDTKEVVSYRARYGAGWIDLKGILSGRDLRMLCQSPKSQLSIRELDMAAVNTRFARLAPSQDWAVLRVISHDLAHGHALATVRVRLGQPAFRAALLERFGNVCAFTGEAPDSALEAAHLYSYAAEGKHHPDSGLLIRRDLHRLFDLGYICVHPDSSSIDIHPELRRYAEYGRLHGRRLCVPVTAGHSQWLTRHWFQHRGINALA